MNRLTQYRLTQRLLTQRLCLVLAMLAALLVAVPNTAEAQTPSSTVVLHGTAGDWITQGNDVTLTEAGETQFFPTVNFDNGVSVRVDVRENGVFVARWGFDFAAPNEAPLAEGDGFHATRWPFQATDVAGLSATGDGRGCNQSTGEFYVYELTHATDGSIETFAADFRQACDGGPAVLGGVRVNSTLGDPDPNFTTDGGDPGDPPDPGDTTPPTATAILAQTGRLKGTDSNFFVTTGCADDNPGVQLVSAEINGISVGNGEKVRLILSNDEAPPRFKKNLWTIQSAHIDLVVTCIDAAGNIGSKTVSPSYER